MEMQHDMGESRMIIFRCRLCLQDIEFIIKRKNNYPQFPIRIENLHGDPLHNLVLFLNDQYDVESFEIYEDKPEESSQLKQSTHKLLIGIGFNELEISIYFKCVEKGPLSIGAIEFLTKQPFDFLKKTVEKYVNKGLFKKIPGAIPYYEALPPYAAIINEMNHFQNFLKEIKIKSPQYLHASFQSIDHKAIGENQFKNFKTSIKKINNDVSSAISEQELQLDESIQQLKLIEMTINDTNLLINAMELDINKENPQNELFGTLNEKLNDIKLKNSIILNEISEISSNIRNTFDLTEDQVSYTLNETQKHVNNISNHLASSLNSLNVYYSKKAEETFNSLISRVIGKFELNNAALHQLWEDSRNKTDLTMHKVWFIRSIEGMKANINDAVIRAKMRLLIVTPTLLDIDLDPLFSLPTFVNIRLVCYIDPNQVLYQKMITQLDSHYNISYHHRELQNLWGFLKDHEEFAFAIVSKPDISGSDHVELAGIGSILDEYVNYFVPLLEDAWMVSKKTGLQKNLEISISHPKEELNATSSDRLSHPIETKSPEIISSARKISNTPIRRQNFSEIIPNSTLTKHSSPNIESTRENPLLSSEVMTILDTIDELKENLPRLTNLEIIKVLGVLSDAIIAVKGYSSVIRFIKIWRSQLRSKPNLDNKTRASFINVLETWKDQIRK